MSLKEAALKVEIQNMRKVITALNIATTDILLAVYNGKSINSSSPEISRAHLANINVRPYSDVNEICGIRQD